MDLNVHRTILFLALRRVQKRLPNIDVMSAFHPLWLGNWLTDMNQASAFFDALDSGYRDPYKVWNGGKYNFAPFIASHRKEWTSLFQTLWEHEWKQTTSWPAFQNLLPSEAKPRTADDIGGYYPYDHFDVVDRHDDQGDLVPESWEFEDPGKTLMTRTVRHGVFTRCLWEQLDYPLSSSLPKRRDIAQLQELGYALHTLQDFFAHTNFVEVLLKLFAQKKKLPEDLIKALHGERVGTFAAYYGSNNPVTTPIMAGRFDRIDTVASILHIYQNSLVPRWRDLAAGGFYDQSGKTRDLIVEVLFGTFSEQPFSAENLKIVKKVLAAMDFFSDIGDALKRGTIKFFAWVGKLLADDEVDRQIDEVKDLLLAVNSAEARDYAKAGRIKYLLHVIEEKLAADLKGSNAPQLPHHTLLAKDHDVGHPEVRLAFKLACCFAVDVTADVLTLYFRGGKTGDAHMLLKRYYQHPINFLNSNSFETALKRMLIQLYGVRWWLWVGKDANELKVP